MRKRTCTSFVRIAIVGLLLCFAAAAALQQFSPGPNDIIQWRTYKDGVNSQARTQAIVEMNSLAEFQNYVRQYAPQGVGDGRDVDWNKEELIAVHCGERPSTGYRVVVESISKVDPRHAQLTFTERTPIKGARQSQATTSPFMIVRLNRFGGLLKFSGGSREDSLPGGIKIIGTGGWNGECDPSDEFRLPFTIFATGSGCDVMLPSNYVINSHDQFNLYLRNYRMKGLDDSSIDYYHERLVAIHLGTKLNSAVSIIVQKAVVTTNNFTELTIYEVMPEGRNALSLTRPTGLYVIVRMPRVGPNVVVTKKQVLESQVRSIGY